jgi:hypothetical protein
MNWGVLLLLQAPILFKGVAATVPSSSELVSTAQSSVGSTSNLPASKPPAWRQQWHGVTAAAATAEARTFA